MKLYEIVLQIKLMPFSPSCITASVSEEHSTGSSRGKLPPGSVLRQVSPGDLTPAAAPTSGANQPYMTISVALPGAQKD